MKWKLESDWLVNSINTTRCCVDGIVLAQKQKSLAHGDSLYGHCNIHTIKIFEMLIYIVGIIASHQYLFSLHQF